jgi:hypothetical protein
MVMAGLEFMEGSHGELTGEGEEGEGRGRGGGVQLGAPCGGAVVLLPARGCSVCAVCEKKKQEGEEEEEREKKKKRKEKK